MSCATSGLCKYESYRLNCASASTLHLNLKNWEINKTVFFIKLAYLGYFVVDLKTNKYVRKLSDPEVP
jgi:hypothetical protein